MRTVIRNLLLAAALPMALAACGDNAAGTLDAGVTGNNQLSVLNPPGDSIGLDFSGSITLRAQLTDAQGQAVAGEPVEFAILQTGDESAGGSSLSGTRAITSSSGIAEIDLVAGAERGKFRIEAKARNAPSVLFYIQVSDQGFSDLSIATIHEGPRDPSTYERVELRIFDDADVHCNTIDFSAPPESLFPPRTQQSLGDESEFRNLAVGLGYTVVAWAEAGVSATPQATGCVHIAADRLRSGGAFHAVLPVRDRSHQLPSKLDLQTDIDLSNLATTLTGAEAWSKLACPLGRSQLLLDCLADAQSPDGVLDCKVGGISPLQTALESRRGPVDSSGCRPATLGNGDDSIDALLAAELSGWPSSAELDALNSGRDHVLGTLRIDSELSSLQSDTARHRLVTATLDSFSVALLETARPVLQVTSVPMVLDASDVLTLGDHRFTLQYGQLAAEGYEVLALEPANVSGLGQTLGAEFINGVAISAQSGCSALETFVCTAVDLDNSCADQCGGIAAALDTHLAGWMEDLQSTGLDYRFELQAVIADVDFDLVVDSLTATSPLLTTELTTDLQSFLLDATISGTAP